MRPIRRIHPRQTAGRELHADHAIQSDSVHSGNSDQPLGTEKHHSFHRARIKINTSRKTKRRWKPTAFSIFYCQSTGLVGCNNCCHNCQKQQGNQDVTSGRAGCFFHDHGSFHHGLGIVAGKCGRSSSGQSSGENEFLHNILQMFAWRHTFLVTTSIQDLTS